MRRSTSVACLAVLASVPACRSTEVVPAATPRITDAPAVEPAPSSPPDPSAQPEPPPASEPACPTDAPMTVRFYDAGQALAVLVTLPHGQQIVVDAGEAPTRAGCGAACRAWHARVMDGLTRDLGNGAIDLMWITHQHSDHLGGVPAIAGRFPVAHYVDNGTRYDVAVVRNARNAVRNAGAALRVVQPDRTDVPIEGGPGVTLRAVVPEQWPSKCRDPNECSIGLRIDYCESSVLFTGDAGHHAERRWPPQDVDLLQIGHHGSDTSSSEAFIAAVTPQYAVAVCAAPSEGTNRTYCHPRAVTLERLTAAMGGPGTRSVRAWAGERCPQRGAWSDIAVADGLWITASDGDVVLVTHGDGRFERVQP